MDWQLDFNSSTEDGRKLTLTGLLTLGGGASVALTGSGNYNSAKGTSSISLKSSGADKGVSIKISNLTVDAVGAITGGTLSYKAYGQSGKLELP